MGQPVIIWERALLGAILLAPKTWSIVDALLDAADFADTRHRRIFEAIDFLLTQSKRLTLVSLKRELEAQGTLEEAGGPAYLVSLVDGVPRSMPAECYAQGLKARAMERRLFASAKRMMTYKENIP